MVVPIEIFIGNDCFSEYLIGHNRDADGYEDRWYDSENDNGEMKTYFYYPQRNVETDLYFSVESYNEGIVPIACTQGTLSNGQFVLFPVVYFAVYKGTRMLVDNYYVDQYHRPILMTAAQNKYSRQYTIYVQYEFAGSPHNDYTLKAYSKYNQPVYNSKHEVNEIHMDGSEPRGFTNSDFKGIDNYECVCGDTNSKKENPKEVLSLLDIFYNTQSIGQFFTVLFEHPWVILKWFNYQSLI